MYRLILIFFCSCFLLSCKQKKAKLTGEEPVEITDFISAFPLTDLPFTIRDLELARPPADSFLIAQKIVRQFIPDTVFSKDFPKGTKPRFHMLGRVEVEDAETYLFLRAAVPARAAAYLLCFDKDHIFKAALPLAYSSQDRNISYEGGMDKRYSIVSNRTRKKGNDQLIYRKNVYVYNSAGLFNLILTESNETVEEKDIYNPIDTLSRKVKWAGDYVRNKKNFISVRDGSSPTRLLFFIHFETADGECSGELKGEADLVKSNLAQYRKANDHCVIEFSFTSQSVSISELQACGNHRGVKCQFQGQFPRKKATAKVSPSKAKKSNRN
jgi:hypothetical protein